MFTNTAYFSEAARDFRNNKGIYCKAPRFSKEYRDYWKIQMERCRDGYSVAGTWITGRHYFYLNFFPIYKVPDKVAIDIYKKRNDIVRTADKIIDFPRFWEIDYEWFRYKHIAWNGGEYDGIKSDGGKHICCGKTRGAGFSYKQASDAVYNYFFILGSKSYFFAASKNFLEGDGVMFKVRSGIDFVNSNILAWKLNAQKRNTMGHTRASYVDSSGQEKGYFSEIYGIVVDDPNKTRGIRGREISFEEAGSFPHLKKAIEISMASVRDGGIYVGQIIVFGTSSESGESLEGLEDIFYSPEAYDMLPFENKWEEDGLHDKIGFFVPCYKADNTSIDENGNCDTKLALEKDEIERQKKLASKDYKQIDRRKAEYPRVPNEMFNRVSNNIFPIDSIDRQIKRINSDADIINRIRYGQLEYSNDKIEAINKVRFIIGDKKTLKPILNYPHKNDDYLDGCVAIYEAPYQDKQGKVPPGMYIVCFDSYAIDEVTDKTSLFACYVIKLNNNNDPENSNLPVASFVGRPLHLTTCYDNLFMLSDYYNATIQGEVGGGGQGVIDFAKQRKQLHKIEFEPEMLGSKETTRSRNRSYLMAMPEERKKLGLSYLSNWVIEERGINENGVMIKNLDRIYDVALLTEMKKFNPKGNFDRISAMIVAMFMLKNTIIIQSNVQTNIMKGGFWSKPLFGGSNHNEFLTGSEISNDDW